MLHERVVRKHFRSDEEFHSIVSGIEPICGIDPGEVHREVAVSARRLQQLEFYDDGDEVNSLHLPIEFGDIFEDNDGNRFILVAQPCDLVVRAKGWRRSETRDKRQIAPLVAIKQLTEEHPAAPDRNAMDSSVSPVDQRPEISPMTVQEEALSVTSSASLGQQARNKGFSKFELHEHELRNREKIT